MNIFNNLLPLFLKNRLIELTLFVTDKCNFKCKHCFMLRSLNMTSSDLTLDEIKSMSKYINKMQRVHIGGGEPLLRDDISDIVLSIANDWNTEVICLPTNGSIENKATEIAKSFGETSRKNLRYHFSLNVMNNEMDSFTNTTDSFQRWEKTIKSVKKITDKYDNITLSVLSTFNDYNQNSILDLIDYVNRIIYPDDFSLCLVRSHKDYQPELLIDRFSEINNKYFRETNHQNPFIRAYRETIRDKIADYYKTENYKIKCYSGRLRVVISPDGFVYPCEKLGYPEGTNKEEWEMGNIRDFNFNIHKLLKSKKAKAIRNKIITNKCHCHNGVDMSINYLCSIKFKIAVLLLGIKYSIL